jgi:hypothetical protein
MVAPPYQQSGAEALTVDDFDAAAKACKDAVLFDSPRLLSDNCATATVFVQGPLLVRKSFFTDSCAVDAVAGQVCIPDSPFYAALYRDRQPS